ncbi:MAG: flagellar biosynthetic protein FliR [Acidocella sp.]|nr:flagellar biosynthetic protein FliR [Acidocella sp.]
MVLSEHQIMLWLGQFLWPFLRITGLFLTAPLFGSAMVPSVVKAALVAAFAAALAIWLPALPAFPDDPPGAIYAGVVQIAYGAMLGMVMQIVVMAVACAGEIAGLGMGLSFAELQFRESPGVTPVLYDVMLWVGLMAFMAAGGPEAMFAVLALSFKHGIGVADINSWSSLAAFGGFLIGSALRLAVPVLAVSLSVNLLVGLTAVFAPQMNLLTIGFPLLILAGLWVMAGTTPYLGPVIGDMMHAGLQAMLRMTNHG